MCELLAKDVSAASTTVALPPQASGSANTGKIGPGVGHPLKQGGGIEGQGQ